MWKKCAKSGGFSLNSPSIFIANTARPIRSRNQALRFQRRSHRKPNRFTAFPFGQIEFVSLRLLVHFTISFYKMYKSRMSVTIDGIKIYPNTDFKPHYVHIRGKKIYTGIQGMCVELVRRWLIKKWGITFPSISNAYEILKLPFFTDIYSGACVPFTVHRNSANKSPPVGSILVWGKDYDEDKTGHVAIVLENHGRLKIMEQNTKTPVRTISMKSVERWIEF